MPKYIAVDIELAHDTSEQANEALAAMKREKPFGLFGVFPIGFEIMNLEFHYPFERPKESGRFCLVRYRSGFWGIEIGDSEVGWNKGTPLSWENHILLWAELPKDLRWMPGPL